jgi:hypothetical protein
MLNSSTYSFDFKICKYVLDQYPDLLNKVDDFGRSPLFYVKSGAVIQELINRGRLSQ